MWKLGTYLTTFIMIEIKDLVVKFDNTVIEYPDFVAENGDFILIIGDSGTGKTTLCELIAKFIKQDSGDIYINRQNTKQLNVFEYIHYLSQVPDNNIIGPTCFEEVELWIKNNGFIAIPPDTEPIVAPTNNTSHREEKSYIYKSLNRFLLSEMVDIPVWKLSFGKKKALAFCCMSLINRNIWVLDEPFAGLDKELLKLIKFELNDFVCNGGIIIATSHSHKDFDEFQVKRFTLK
jgi:cobalt/nickel transport system ATP-binding protein